MKQITRIKFITIIAALSFCSPKAFAQLDSCNVFLKGNYVEVGVNTNGAFGSSVAAPAGYHPKGGNSIHNTCYPSMCVTFGTNLGFVADPAKDGWTVGTPPYFGDYFLPGAPQEGWSIQADSFRMDAWNGNDGCGSGVPFTYAGTKSISSSFGNVSYNAVGHIRSGVWQGVFDSLNIEQTTILDTSKVFFTMYVTISNLTNHTIRNIYYLRTVDPDNDEPDPGGSFTTDNNVDTHLPSDRGALVTATGTSSSLAYLGLGTLDCRARAFLINNSLYPQTGIGPHKGLDDMYSDTDLTYYQYTGSRTWDEGIGLVFKLDSLLPGQCTSLAYAYILSKADLADAFASTAPRWADLGDTTSYASRDSAVVCKNSLVTVGIVNGGCHDWTWYSLSGNYISNSHGTSTNVLVDSTPASLMAIGTNGSCLADTVYMTILPTISVAPKVHPFHYCVGNPATPLTADVDSTATLIWYTSDPSDTGSTIAPTPSTDSVGVFMYYVAGKYKGCLSNKVPIAVTVDPVPPPLVVGNNGPLCLHEKLELTGSAVAGSYYQWTGPNGFTSDLQNPTIDAVVAADSGLFTLSDSLEGCPMQKASTNVLVDNVFARVLSDKNAACIGDTLHLNFGGHIPDTNSTIKWGFDNGTIVSGDITGESKGPYVIRWDSMGSKYVTVTVQNWRCISKVIDTIPVAFAPDVMFSMPKDICLYDTVKAVVSEYSMTNADSLAWDWGGGSQIYLGGPASRANGYVSFNSTGQKIILLTIGYPQCIRAPYADTVMVHSLPTAQIESLTDQRICQGDVVTFHAPVNSLYKYTWAPANFVTGTQGLGNSTANITIMNTGYVYLTVHDQYNCAATDSLMVNADACCQVSFPSAFTPNGDGRNDVFRPITVGNHHVKIFRVVNRYGQTVFESNVETQGWDGNLFGVPQDPGTYFYYFNYQCNGKTIEKKGDVTLIR